MFSAWTFYNLYDSKLFVDFVDNATFITPKLQWGKESLVDWCKKRKLVLWWQLSGVKVKHTVLIERYSNRESGFRNIFWSSLFYRSGLIVVYWDFSNHGNLRFTKGCDPVPHLESDFMLSKLHR